MEVYASSLPRKWRPCLKCGKSLFTDKWHRICPKCTEENAVISHLECRAPRFLERLMLVEMAVEG